MTISFLTVADDSSPAPARSPMEQACIDLGGQLTERAGAAVFDGFGDREREEAACRNSVGLAETTSGRKLELLAAPGLEDSLAEIAGNFVSSAVPGTAWRLDQGWWCTYSPRRALLLSDPATRSEKLPLVVEAFAETPGLSAIEVSGGTASVTLAGPFARDVIARFCALDLRPSASAPGDFHPGSLARVPGAILHESSDRFRLLFGWAYGEYVWNVIADAIDGFDGALVGIAALPPIEILGEGDHDA